MKLLWQLFITFFKIGAFTFGGGLAMLPMIRKEVSKTKGWVGEEELVDCFAIAQSLPGVIALNVAIYVGNKMKGTAGALAAAVGMAAPAFLSIIIILLFLEKIEENRYVLGAFEGIKAASAGLILVVACKMAKKMLVGMIEILVASVSFLIIVIGGISAVWAIVIGAFVGYVSYAVRKKGASS